MIFNEVYSAYFNAVAAILRSIADHPTDIREMRDIISEHAFGESTVTIEQCIRDEKWQIVTADGRTNITHTPTMPLTLLQKQWLKAIAADPRIRLFDAKIPDFPDAEPLFTPDDFMVYDKYSDGDPYENEEYIKIFRTVLGAVRNSRTLKITTENRRGTLTEIIFRPRLIEYSEKDDKFRVIGTGGSYTTVNIARIVSCEVVGDKADVKEQKKKSRTLEFDLTDDRNALERVLMHFAHFEKQVVKTGERTYHVLLSYDKDDETEMVIRMLSFGPLVEVTAPARFRELIIQRLRKQMRCGL